MNLSAKEKIEETHEECAVFLNLVFVVFGFQCHFMELVKAVHLFFTIPTLLFYGFSKTKLQTNHWFYTIF